MTIKRLVFEGGGVKGIAHAGALRALVSEGYIDLAKVEQVSGASAEALVALAVALGYSADELIKIMKGLDFKKLKDGNHVSNQPQLDSINYTVMPDQLNVTGIDILSPIINFFTDFGIYGSDGLKKFIIKLMTDKGASPHLRFHSLTNAKEFKSLYIPVANASTGHTMRFAPDENADTPIWLAVLASMTFPFGFKSVEAVPADRGIDYGFKPANSQLYKVNQNIFTLCDGGIANNCPYKIFNKYYTINNALPPEEMVIFKLEKSDEDIQYKKYLHEIRKANIITTLAGYTSGIINVSLNNQEDNFKRDKYAVERTVFSKTGNISVLDFGLSTAKKDLLLNSGEEAAKEFIKLEKNRLNQLNILSGN